MASGRDAGSRGMKRQHTHPCSLCATPVACDGQWERNHDGFPDAICPNYHSTNGEVVDVRCDDCLGKTHYCGMCDEWFRKGGDCRKCGFELVKAA